MALESYLRDLLGFHCWIMSSGLVRTAATAVWITVEKGEEEEEASLQTSFAQELIKGELLQAAVLLFW